MTIAVRKAHTPQQRMDVFFLEACRRYLKNGGSAGYAQDILMRAISELRVEDGKANDAVPTGHSQTASSSSSQRDGEGLRVAGSEHRTYVRDALSARNPSPSQLAAAASVANVVAITVLDSYKIRDGRSIGDVRWGEIDRLHGQNAREAHVLFLIKRHVAYAGHDEKIRHIVKARDLEAFIQRAAELSDAG